MVGVKFMCYSQGCRPRKLCKIAPKKATLGSCFRFSVLISVAEGRAGEQESEREGE